MDNKATGKVNVQQPSAYHCLKRELSMGWVLVLLNAFHEIHLHLPQPFGFDLITLSKP